MLKFGCRGKKIPRFFPRDLSGRWLKKIELKAGYTLVFSVLKTDVIFIVKFKSAQKVPEYLVKKPIKTIKFWTGKILAKK